MSSTIRRRHWSPVKLSGTLRGCLKLLVRPGYLCVCGILLLQSFCLKPIVVKGTYSVSASAVLDPPVGSRNGWLGYLSSLEQPVGDSVFVQALPSHCPDQSRVFRIGQPTP